MYSHENVIDLQYNIVYNCKSQSQSPWYYGEQTLTLIYGRLSRLHIFLPSLPLLSLISLPRPLLLLLTPSSSPPCILPLKRGGHMLQTCSVPSGWLPVILTPGESSSAGYATGEHPSCSAPLHTWAETVNEKKKHTGRKLEREKKKTKNTVGKR